MRNIIIVECISTGVNFIEDIINRGYNPIVLEPKMIDDTEEGEQYKKEVHEQYKRIKYDFEIIYEKDSYEDTLEMVKKFDPLLVLPGNERGVVLASKLAYDLNLKCNDIKNIDAMTLKDGMHNRLKEYGIRYIKGKVVKSIDEALEFYNEENLSQVVLKPTYSSGSVGVRTCSNKKEMTEALEELFTKSTRFGAHISDILVQERIIGDEYIVNTVSCEGMHKVTLIWKYKKVKTEDGAIIYDSAETVNELTIGEAEMVEYAYQVADAIGIQYGPVHGEYMIDEKGPVLIEVNCRPCGLNMEPEFLNRISGQHETDSILDAYLKPELFKANRLKPYNLYAHSAIKLFIVPKDIIAKSSPMDNISYRFKSHYKTSMANIVDGNLIPKTEDLHTHCGLVYLVHEDYDEVQDNINFLRDIEKRAFSMVLREEEMETNKKDDQTYLEEIIPFLNMVKKYGTGFIITDQLFDNIGILQSKPEDIDNISGEFDFVVINLNKSYIHESDYNIISLSLKSLSRVKSGGFVFIPKNTYEQIPSKRNGMETIIQTLGLKIEVPPCEIKDIIIASRR